MNLRDLAGRVEAATGPVKWGRNNTEFKACCCCHDEKTASANFKLGSTGKIIAYCFGCGASGEKIAAALDIDFKEFFPPKNDNGYKNGAGAQRATAGRKPLLDPKTTRYRILNPEGKLVAVHVRIDGIDQDTNKPAKRMWWEAADGSKGRGPWRPRHCLSMAASFSRITPTRKCRL
jgi:hypothetical protein